MMGRLLLLGKIQYKPSWPGECIRRQMLFVLSLFTWFDCLLFLLHKPKICSPFPSLATRIAYSNSRGRSLVLTFRRNGESKADAVSITRAEFVQNCWKMSYPLRCTEQFTQHPEFCLAAVIPSLLLEEQYCLTQPGFGKPCRGWLHQPLLKQRNNTQPNEMQCIG